MEAGRPVSLLKKGVDDLKETWPGEPDRFLEHHIDPFLLWCVKKNASDITWQSNTISALLLLGKVAMVAMLGRITFVHKKLGDMGLARSREPREAREPRELREHCEPWNSMPKGRG